MSLLINPAEARRTGREADRTANRERQPRSAQEARPKDTYYRKDYGWIMSDANVKTEQGIKAKYDENTANVKGQVSANEQKFQTDVTKGQTDINSAYDTAIAEMASKANPARVEKEYTIKGNSYNASEYKEAYTDPDTKRKVSMSQQALGLLEKDIAKYGFDGYGLVGQRGGGDPKNGYTPGSHKYITAYQQEYDKVMSQNQATVNASTANANNERAARLDGFNKTSSSNYAAARALWDAEINKATSAYDNRVATGKETYEANKKRYSDSVKGVDIGLLDSPTNQVNPGIR